MNEHSEDAMTLRTGARRLIPRWELRHRRGVGYARIGGGAALTTCGLLTLAFGGRDAKTYGWAAFFLFFAALDLAGGIWGLRISASS